MYRTYVLKCGNSKFKHINQLLLQTKHSMSFKLIYIFCGCYLSKVIHVFIYFIVNECQANSFRSFVIICFAQIFFLLCTKDLPLTRRCCHYKCVCFKFKIRFRHSCLILHQNRKDVKFAIIYYNP